jgi:hypothetical protein
MHWNRKLFSIGMLLILIIAVTNIPGLRLGIMVMLGDPEYKKTNFHYSSADPNGFSVWSRKGYKDVLEQFDLYKQTHPGDTVLYRNFQVDNRKFWRWYAYWSEEQYALPFRELPADAYVNSRGGE